MNKTFTQIDANYREFQFVQIGDNSRPVFSE